MSQQKSAELFIGNEKRRGSGDGFININPATGKTIGEIYAATPAEMDEAVQNAAAAFAAWKQKPAAARGKILQAAAKLLRERVPELAKMETLDTGKPISEALAVDVPSAADALEYFGGIAASLSGQHIDLGTSFAYTRREPLGVCGGIGAWNFPLQIACWKLAPALAAGNTFVFKPSELTPTSAVALAEILREAGLPAGVFNVVQGGAAIGSALCRHPQVAKISLTGSVPTGIVAMQAAASTLKHLTLELGGKSPLIIFDDAPVDQAVSGALLANFFTQGEVCSNGTRVFVAERMYQQFIQKLLPRVQKIRLGDPLKPETQMGALISAKHLERVQGFIRQGEEEGATLLCGGRPPTWGRQEEHLKDGFFLTPAVFTDCQDEMKIVREEIFGPVMTVLPFRDEDEVITRANATEYGLAAGVFTRDLTRAHRVVAALEAGTCWINNYNITPLEVPFGGVKKSGLGCENGIAALEHYTRLKSVYVEMADLPPPF